MKRKYHRNIWNTQFLPNSKFSLGNSHLRSYSYSLKSMQKYSLSNEPVTCTICNWLSYLNCFRDEIRVSEQPAAFQIQGTIINLSHCFYLFVLVTNQHNQDHNERKTEPNRCIEGDVVLDEREWACNKKASLSSETEFLFTVLNNKPLLIISHILLPQKLMQHTHKGQVPFLENSK